MASPEPKTDASDNANDYLVVGKFRRTHGIRGDLLFTVITDFPERLRPGTNIYVGSEFTEFKISRVKPHNDGIVFGFKELTNPEDAKKFVGSFVYVPAADRPNLPEGEFYHHQIVGLKVIDTVRGELGVISEILETGANDVYVVQTLDEKEILFPALQNVIQNVDLTTGTMSVTLPEGLI